MPRHMLHILASLLTRIVRITHASAAFSSQIHHQTSPHLQIPLDLLQIAGDGHVLQEITSAAAGIFIAVFLRWGTGARRGGRFEYENKNRNEGERTKTVENGRRKNSKKDDATSFKVTPVQTRSTTKAHHRDNTSRNTHRIEYLATTDSACNVCSKRIHHGGAPAGNIFYVVENKHGLNANTGANTAYSTRIQHTKVGLRDPPTCSICPCP